MKNKFNRRRVSLGLVTAMSLALSQQNFAQEDYTSKVPQYTFSETLAEQEKELADNPLLKRFTESRKKLMEEDPHRPYYHFTSPEYKLNDPNGLSYWQGRWHLFYQAYPPEDPRQHWGHAVSTDLVHWRDLPYAIYPNPESKVYSGSAYVEEDRVIAMYHGVDAGTMVATSDDPLLLNWDKLTGQAVIPFPKDGEPKPPHPISDPNIWKKDGIYYTLLTGAQATGPGGKRVRLQSLLKSKDLKSWEYMHPFVENDRYSLVGDDGACPYFWPIGDSGKHILLYFSHMSGGKYMIGDYDTEKDKFFVTGGGDFNHGAVHPAGVHAPSASPDPNDPRSVIAIFNMNQGKPLKTWDRLMTLPRRLILEGEDLLLQEPAGDIESLRREHHVVGETRLPANEEVVFEEVKGNAMELIAEIDPKDAAMIEMDVLRSPEKQEYTRIMFYRDRGFSNRDRPHDHIAGVCQIPQYSAISIDTSNSSTLPEALSRPPETASVFLKENEPLKLRVFVDRSVVEVFVNGRQVVAVRAYPGRDDSLGVSLRAQGRDAQLISLDAWQMENIFE